MFIRLRIVISGAIVLVAASAALSKETALPTIDIQKQCRASQSTTDALFGNKNANAFEQCVNSEQTARGKLVDRWKTIPPADKTSCIHPRDYSPSYFEWLGCVDTRVYVLKMRTERPISLPNSAICPTVSWQINGEIASMVACNLPQ
ncbi:MAG TPA: hypothetical protein VI251_11865 [Pseudolabrys sp.]|jgi:hypothetical protein